MLPAFPGRSVSVNKYAGLGFIAAGLAVSGCMATESAAAEAKRAEIVGVMTRVGDWMQANRRQTVGGRRHDTNWTVGAWYAGQYALYDVTKLPRHLKPLMAMARRTGWRVGRHILLADSQCISQTYIDLYMNVKKDPEMIAHTQEVLDGMMANPVDLPMHDHGRVCFKGEWSWCDSLFVGPPVWAKLAKATGESKYLDFMDRKWWKTHDFLYDREEHLYFRDAKYFDRKEANGRKMFWGRGNGWVLAGLVRVLEDMPKRYKSRGRYEDLYKEMSVKIASLQMKDGFWRASLLDPGSFPGGESSGTAFLCYSLAWGINNGYLDEATYLPVVKKAWNALNRAVHPSGKLGWVQGIAAEPGKTTREATEVYAVGAFLLAGREMLQLATDL